MSDARHFLAVLMPEKGREGARGIPSIGACFARTF